MESKILTAKEAFSLTFENLISIEKIMEDIEIKAKKGQRRLIVAYGSIYRIKEELKKLGYRIEDHRNPTTDILHHIICW